MTIGDLREALAPYTEDMPVVLSCSEESTEPSPRVVRQSFELTYWNGNDFKTIPAGTEYVEL